MKKEDRKFEEKIKRELEFFPRDNRPDAIKIFADTDVYMSKHNSMAVIFKKDHKDRDTQYYVNKANNSGKWDMIEFSLSDLPMTADYLKFGVNHYTKRLFSDYISDEREHMYHFDPVSDHPLIIEGPYMWIIVAPKAKHEKNGEEYTVNDGELEVLKDFTISHTEISEVVEKKRQENIATELF